MLLRSMRKGFMSALFLGLLVLGGLSLVLSDSTGTLRGRIGDGDVATVDGTKIKINEFNSRVSRVLKDQRIDLPTAYNIGLINNILNNEVFELLIKKDATQLGIRIEDRIVAEQIKTIIAPYKSDNTDDKAALKRFLEQQGMTEKQLVQILRDDLTSKILKATISTADYVPNALVHDFQAYNQISKNIEFVFTPNSTVTVKNMPSDADLKTYYQNLESAYMIPEKRDISIAVLDVSKLPKPTITDADIKAAYDENKDGFMIPESANLEQIVVDDETKAKKIISTASKEKLSDAVKSVMGDLKSFQKSADFAKDSLPSAIATAVFSGKSGDIIGPIKTPLGYHVIQLNTLSAAKTASFDSVKDKIRKEMEAEKIGTALLDITTDIEDRLANGETFEELKQDYPVTVTSLKSLQKNTQVQKDNPFSQKEFTVILNKAFSLKDNSPSELGDLNTEKLFSVRADKIFPSAPKEFSSVKPEILKTWISDYQAQENLIATQKRIDDLSAGKTKFTDLKPTQIESLTRKGTDAIAKDIVDRVMNAETGKFILAISKEKNGVYIVRANSDSIPTDLKVDDETRNRIESDISNATYMGYMDSLQTKYPVSINSELLKRLYGTSNTNSE